MNSKSKAMIIAVIAALAIGGAAGYYFGYDHGFERASTLIQKSPN